MVGSQISLRGRAAAVLSGALLAAVLVLTLPGQAAAASTDWTELRTLNITHQGGEDEAPSNTMYALERSMRLGADMLELDIHTSSDGDLIVIHDGTVDRTTNGSGSVYEMTTAEIKALDAGHNIVPGEGTESDRPDSDYPFRGVRLGEKPPPPAFTADDFTIPTLPEVIEAYPNVPINIEIKGASDEDLDSFLRNAEALATYLNDLGRSEGIMVASFNDAALQAFHDQAPQIDLAPAVAGVAQFKLTGVPPGPQYKAFQVPISFSGVEVTDEQFITDAHANDMGVHVWTINDEETMLQLLDWGADGIMTAEPARLEKVLCENNVKRPPPPTGFPDRHCSERVSIACDVTATKIKRKGRKATMTLTRGDDFDSRCAGRYKVKGLGTKAKRKGTFDFTWTRPSDGGPTTQKVKFKLNRKLRRAINRRGKLNVLIHPYTSFVTTERVKVR